MKKCLAILIYVFIFGCSPNDYLELLEPNSPGKIPQKFADRFISTNDAVEFSCTFSPDGKEFYFTRRDEKTPNRIYFTKYLDGNWTEPKIAEFSEDHWCNEPSITPDGNRIYFGSKRKLNDTSNITKDAQIWYCDKVKGVWSVPKHLGPGMMYVSATRTGDIYYTDKTGQSMSDCFIAFKKNKNNFFEEQEIVNIPTENIHGMAHPFIDPEESFLIYDYNDDLYVVFNQEDGWSSPIKLDDNINTSASECCAYVTADKKYLFFTRFEEDKETQNWKGDLYWVGTEVLFNLKEMINE